MRVDCSITENFIKERIRICTTQVNCSDCLLKFPNGVCYSHGTIPDIAKTIKTVQKWSDEHQQMTNLDYLLEHFPNTKLDEEGIPDEICPDSIGLPLADGMVCKGNAVDCKKCWSGLYEEK